MSSIIETLDKIRYEFSIFSDPRDKYIFLVDLAKDLDGLSSEEKVEENRIHGCTSQAWVTCKRNGEKYFFQTDSAPMIVRGQISIIQPTINDNTKQKIIDSGLKTYPKILGKQRIRICNLLYFIKFLDNILSTYFFKERLSL